MTRSGTAAFVAACSLLVVVEPFGSLRANVCKWCLPSTPVCTDNICLSNCNLSSYCSFTEEICIAIWRKTNETMTVHTMCHHPNLPLEGINPRLLLNFTSRECHMLPQPADEGVMMVCGCQGEQECNDKLIFDKGVSGFSRLHSKDVIPVVIVSLVPPLLVAMVATAVFYSYRMRRPDKPGPASRSDWPTKCSPELYQVLDHPRGEAGGGVVVLGVEPVINNTKGRCPNKITVGKRIAELLPIKLEDVVGRGRFAEVWRARLLQSDMGGVNSYETVAVKVFPNVEYASWRNECSILSDPTLQHENLVQFLAAEERSLPSDTLRTYWLVLAHYSLGNMQDYLTANTLSWEELVALASSIANGLAHLHSETKLNGAPKVPVAHRDLKSSNILIKNRKQCVLCDFGLALRLDISLTVDDYANSGQVGTARYMAPEVLESRVNLEDLEAFKQMDIYSMALVLWEMASRCDVIEEVKAYEPAFGSKVCEQPCVDSMRDLVLRDRGRPDIPSAWTQHQGMSVFCSTITECWDHDPEARLTAHCVVERFNAMQHSEEEVVLEDGGLGGGRQE
uniref:TGF-beta receptor type-2 n=1 Tax=Oryzias latipes TaxID=8090 RepID=A0A3P9KBB8_ORYLA